ncbi:MAG: MBL fold metallo-hydrolase [Acidimicrobiales bacterium]|jgi:UDP-MurNAc hydroxylase|nr:MBL fold metallo-hydrolase [Acidimicrobiales bacterium]
MRVTVIGHSCLQVATRAGTILVDPWLFGSCYWRSWWHFPPSQEPTDEMLAPDWIYLTHHHFDHFHYPSMRRMDRSAKVLIPRFGVDVMADEVVSLGFDRPEELRHGRVFDLGDGVRVASYQYGFDDTAFVVAEDDNVIVDVNDCKIRGRAIAPIVKEFGPIALAFKSHSFAQSYPVLYESEDPGQLSLVSTQTYLDDFHDVMSALRPRHAIPFGSMVGFLHPDSAPLNEHLVTPEMVVDGMAAKGGIEGADVVTMAPGDVWDSEAGFDRSDVDWYTDRERHLTELTGRNQPKIDAQAESEVGVVVEWRDFEAHLSRLVRDVPRVFARRLAPKPFVFHVPSDEEAPYWWVSFRSRSVGRSATVPEGASGVTTVPEAVLAEAIQNRIVHFLHGAMRIRTSLAPGGVQSDLGWWGVVMMWELGYLPLRRSARHPRLWRSLGRRWREFVDQAPSVIARNPVDHLAERFGADV